MRIRKKLVVTGMLCLCILLFVGAQDVTSIPAAQAMQQAKKHHSTPTPSSDQAVAITPQVSAVDTPTPIATVTPQIPGVDIPGSLEEITPAAGAPTYYVSPAGDDANDGSIAHPFATIQKAAQVVVPGAIVYVLPGTYTQPVTITTSGTASAPIMFISQTKWGAKIQTTGTQDPWTTSADYIDIMDFDVSSTGSRDGIENRGSYIRTIGNHVHNIPGGCDSMGGSGIDDAVYTAHDDDIIGNVVNNIGATYPQMCEYVHGIYHSTARGHIMNNIAYDNAGCGINLWHAATATIVTNNLSFGNKEHGISVGTNTDNTGGAIGDDFIVANNISIDNGRLGIRERIGVGSHNQYLNNIVYGNGSAPFGDEQYNWPSAAGSKDVNTITKPVQFVRYASDGTGDFHVFPGSPAIDAGTSIGAPATDIDGNPRPQGKGYDVGPYENE